MNNNLKYVKPPLSINQQIGLLEKRGMLIENHDFAYQLLDNTNYYRFSGYALYFEVYQNGKRTHQFKPGTTFKKVANIYAFDTALRKLFSEYLEKIEISFRTRFVHELSFKYKDSHWYMNKGLFIQKFDYNKFIEDCRSEAERSHETFIRHYKKKYTIPELPASWMMTEIISFSKWSLVYKSLLKREDKKRVSDNFNCSPVELESWMHGLSVLRNFCAHHCRIWNRKIPVPLKLRKKDLMIISNYYKIASYVIIMQRILETIDPEDSFLHNFCELIRKNPSINVKAMGINSKHEFWRKKLH